jgi:NAD-dependent SIR2 family protein deacetylase
MKCQFCEGSIVSELGYYMHPARLKCLSCGREAKMEEKIEPKVEQGTKQEKLCKVCGKPTGRGHHHGGHPRVQNKASEYIPFSDEILDRLISAFEAQAKRFSDLLLVLTTIEKYVPPKVVEKIEAAIREAMKRLPMKE